MSVSSASLAAMAGSAAFCVLLPVGVLVWWRRTEHAQLLPALWGALTFLVFSQGLESVLHCFCLLSDNAVSRAIWGSPWLYMLYGALTAGIFEECGRFVMFKTLLRRYPERSAAVTAGIGHGGVESILLSGLSLALTFVFALYWRAGDLAAIERIFGDPTVLAATAATLGKYSVGYCLLTCLERVSALVLHISLSIFVFQAARAKGRRSGLIFAIALHAIFDMPAALYQSDLLRDLVAVELWLIVCALYALRSARKCYLEECDA